MLYLLPFIGGCFIGYVFGKGSPSQHSQASSKPLPGMLIDPTTGIVFNTPYGSTWANSSEQWVRTPDGKTYRV